MYLVEKTINKLYQDGYTFFLNPYELEEVCHHLKNNTYKIYKPYEDAEKTLLYQDNVPDIILYEIKIPIKVRHQDILGSLFSLQIEDNLFGDIILWNDHYYFYTFRYMQNFFEMEFTKIRNANITLEEKDISILENYQPSFEVIKIITSSLRIDSVIAKVIHTNRDSIKDLIKDKKIVYNNELLKSGTKNLQEKDTFSIRKIGKFRFEEIEGTTKSQNMVLRILKYIDN